VAEGDDVDALAAALAQSIDGDNSAAVARGLACASNDFALERVQDRFRSLMESVCHQTDHWRAM
jgi:hypothetical protein